MVHDYYATRETECAANIDLNNDEQRNDGKTVYFIYFKLKHLDGVKSTVVDSFIVLQNIRYVYNY